MSTQKGRWAENAACHYLQEKGYRILARNFRSPCGEIDIVARKNDLVVFVEVRFRKQFDDALWSLHSGKQKRLRSTAQAFLHAHPEFRQLQCRFDFIILTDEAKQGGIAHLEDAFR